MMKEPRFWKKHQFLFSLLVILVVTFFCFSLLGYPQDESKVMGFRDLLPTIAPYPVLKNNSLMPELTAKAAFVRDIDSGVVLYEKNPDLRLSPASTTKLMTALVARENYPLDKVLGATGQKLEGNNTRLQPGERLTVENLLYALLVGSVNEAAITLAENFPQGEAGFVWAMNQKAKEMGLKNTNFENPVGFDDDNHYSTARDLVYLTRAAIKDAVILKMIGTSGLTISDVTGKYSHYLKNTDELVGESGEIKGGKTGWTQNAGECLVSLINKDNQNMVAAVLGSQDRFGETKVLVDWILTNYDWQIIAPTSYR